MGAGTELAQYLRDVRERFPSLVDMPDSLLLSQPIDALCRLAREEKAAENKGAKNLEQRAHQNAARAAANPEEVHQGVDNRTTILHEARYLPGAAVPLQQHWHAARQRWGQDRVGTLLTYDMRSLGHAGCVTARGWDAIHHPGSADISLKLFSIANVGRAATGLKSLNAVNEDGFVISDSLKELSDMLEVKAALQNLCMAAQLAAPWNFLFLVIDSFLKSTTNMEADLASYKKAPIVAAFIDHVLQVNAANWMCDSDFLDMPALKSLWESWWCARKGTWKAETAAAAATTTSGSTSTQANNSGGQGDAAGKNSKRRRGRRGGGGQGGQGGQNNGGGDGSFGGHQQNRGGPPSGFFGGPQRQPSPNARNLCRRFNEGTCNNHYSACSFMGKFGPVKLYHLCNFMKRDNGEQKLCMERHSRVEFHK
jgi:uncharacterized membrane protein YgcG